MDLGRRKLKTGLIEKLKVKERSGVGRRRGRGNGMDYLSQTVRVRCVRTFVLGGERDLFWPKAEATFALFVRSKSWTKKIGCRGMGSMNPVTCAPARRGNGNGNGNGKEGRKAGRLAPLTGEKPTSRL